MHDWPVVRASSETDTGKSHTSPASNPSRCITNKKERAHFVSKQAIHKSRHTPPQQRVCPNFQFATFPPCASRLQQGSITVCYCTIMNTYTRSELRVHPSQLGGRPLLPVVAEAPRHCRLQLVLNPNPDELEGKHLEFSSQVHVVYVARTYELDTAVVSYKRNKRSIRQQNIK